MKSALRIIGITISILIITCSTGAEVQHPLVDIYTTENGLSSTKISCITQDEKGFIWIGTEDGLNKFDGYRFAVYKRTPNDSLSLVSDHITALYRDSQQRLWVGTIDGLQYYDPDNEGFIRASLNQPDYVIRNNQCIAIMEDSRGGLWFTASGLGVLYYDRDKDESHLYTPSHTQANTTLCGIHIRCMTEDKQGNIFFGSQDNGISVYDPANKTFKNFNTHNSNLPGNSIFALYTLENGDILISSLGGGLAIYDHEKKEVITYPGLFTTLATQHMFCAIEDRRGNLLAGTEGNGLMLFDRQHKRFEQHPAFREKYQEIGDTKVHVLYEDKYGYIWAGMNNKGLCVIRQNENGFTSYRRIANNPNSLSYGHVMGITTDKNKEVWIATDGGGLNRYNPATGIYTHYRHKAHDPRSITDNAVVTVYCDSKNRIWAGTYVGGLCLFDRQSETFTSYRTKDGLQSDFIKSIIEDKDGNLWIGTCGGGLHHFDVENKTFRNFRQSEQPGLINDHITRLYLDSQGYLWIGSYFGLSLMNTVSESFTAYGPQQGLSDVSVYAITEDSNGTVWIGTQGGLNRYDPQTDRFITVTPTVHNYNRVINGIVPDGDLLWLSTNNGIFAYYPANNTARHYTTYDGLQGNEFLLSSYYKSPEGEIFFGGTDGCNSFYPENIKSTIISPKVYFTTLRIFNQEVNINEAFNGRVILPQNLSVCKEITLQHDEMNFTIEFTAPDTPWPTATFYACKMEGFDHDWITYDHTRRYVTYTNLNPGTYTLLAKASNDTETWGKEFTALTIIVPPPLWATWWAILIYILFGCMVVFFVVRFLIIRFREKEELRLERLKVKQQEEVNQEKMQFFTNISHEFQTPLTLIIGPLERLLQSEKDPEKLQTLQMMLRNAERLFRLINQILELRKVEQRKVRLQVHSLELISFASRILGSFTALAEKKSIALTYTWGNDHIPVWYDPDMLDKCLYNILSNAFKYTPEGGRIEVDIRRDEEGYVYIRISDTGIGMNPDTVGKLFERFYQADSKSFSGTGIGLNLTKSIIDLHGGDITVESSEGEGSTFCISIPPGNSQFTPEELSEMPYKQESLFHTIDLPPSEKEEETMITDEQAGKDESQYTLLLVEDDEDMRNHIRKELENNYAIIEAINGKDGLAKARKFMPDLIITDVMMPEMSGIELCRILKTEMETSHIPVIILTAQGDMEHRIEGLETGADSYIPKPFHAKHLKIRIAKLIELRQNMKERFSKSLNMEAQEVTLTSTDERLLQQVIDYIRTHIEDSDMSVEAMSKELGISRTHLHRKLKALTGQSPIDFIKVIRMKQAAYLLTTGKLTISEVGYKVGFNSPSYFSSCFNTHFGMSPTQYIEQYNKD